MGDFNYPDIDWSLSLASSSSSQYFVDCVDDGFLTQHVTESTCNGKILDLVFTSDADMIDSVTVLSPLGNSDHNMLEWEVQLSPVSMLINRPSFNYAQGNFTAIRQALKETDWSAILQGDGENQWQGFRNVLTNLEAQQKPIKTHDDLNPSKSLELVDGKLHG